jgi:Cu/Ag efflux pump CusA
MRSHPHFFLELKFVTGYDRSWLINESIKTLKRDLILEAIIVSFVGIALLKRSSLVWQIKIRKGDLGRGIDE